MSRAGMDTEDLEWGKRRYRWLQGAQRTWVSGAPRGRGLLGSQFRVCAAKATPLLDYVVSAARRVCGIALRNAPGASRPRLIGCRRRPAAFLVVLGW